MKRGKNGTSGKQSKKCMENRSETEQHTRDTCAKAWSGATMQLRTDMHGKTMRKQNI